jgi:CubicO group peptidase (beta-lactamase class C family)
MPNDFSDADYRQNWTEDQLLAKARAMPLDFPPGTNWRYSNVGYVVLGLW